MQVKDQPETSCIGNKWTDDEDNMLILSISIGKSISDIAHEHKRTLGGIKSRLRVIAIRMIEKEGKNIEEVCTILRMNPIEIEDAKMRRDNSIQTKDKSPIRRIETEIDVLKDI